MNTILSKDLTETLLATRYAFSKNAFSKPSGYGCGIYKELGDHIFFIVGGDAGVGFDSRYWVEEGIVFNVLSNHTHGEETIREVFLAWHETRKS